MHSTQPLPVRSSVRLMIILFAICLAAALVLLAVIEAAGAEPTAAPAASAGQGAAADWAPVEKAMGKSGSMQPGDVFRINMPRSDLKVTVGGVAIQPGLALGSWAAFKKSDGRAAVMGDLVLTESEAAPVMKKLEAGGIEVTGFHNHLLGETPRLMYLHIHGHGDAAALAEAIHAALVLTGTPLGEAPTAAAKELALDTTGLDAIIGYRGKTAGAVYQYGIPRARKVIGAGMEVPPSMGTAIAINFQSAGGGKAATTGDFVLTADEVNPVITALVANGIEVTAIHNHMMAEEPRLFFLHFWAVDDQATLARGLRAALDKVDVSAPSGGGAANK